MANQVNFDFDTQLEPLRILVEGTAPTKYVDAYNLVNSWIQGTNVDLKTKLFFQHAVEVNTNAPTAANLYIRTITQRGLEMDGKDASPGKLQQISDAIAQAIFRQIVREGGMPQIADIIKTDVNLAITDGGQTWGGWGGALFFLTEPADARNRTVAKNIFSNNEETRKFTSLTIEATLASVNQYGYTSDLFVAAWQAWQSSVATLYGVNDLGFFERSAAYYSLIEIGGTVTFQRFTSDAAQLQSELQAWIDILPVGIHDLPILGDGKIVISGLDASTVQTTVAAAGILRDLAARLPIDMIVVEPADASGTAMYGSDRGSVFSATQGNDTIYGGAGVDTYVFETLAGSDRIIDPDTDGTVIVNGSQINIVLEDEDTAGVYKTPNGTLTLNDNTGLLTVSDGVGDSIVIEDWQDGDLGINLRDAQTAHTDEQITLTLAGDLEPVDFDPDTPGIQTQTDSLGNVIVDPGTPASGRADTLFGDAGANAINGFDGGDSLSGRAGDDDLDGGTGDDALFGEAGFDRLLGSAGEDFLDGGADDDELLGGADGDALQGGLGYDRMAGQAGRDLLSGQEGDDELYAGELISLTDLDDALVAGDTEAGTGLAGDLLDGGAGEDVAIGGADDDQISGAGGADVLAGGGGADNLQGDWALFSANPGWAATRTVTTEADGTTVYAVTHTDAFFTIAPDGGNDEMYGGTGDDWLFAGAGDDYLDGGARSGSAILNRGISGNSGFRAGLESVWQ